MNERPHKRMADSRQYLAEIVGAEHLAGQRMQAGAILDLMDVVAGRTASTHSGTPVVTLSFDRVELLSPIIHLDLVRLDAYVADVGRSSITVGVDVTRQDAYTRDFMPVQSSYVTMVAIDRQRQPNRSIPSLQLETPAEHALNADALAHKDVTRRWLELQEQARRRSDLTVAEVEDPLNRDKREYLSPAETTVTVRRMFMPRHQNVLGTIFGGDILLWMDRVATYAARLFTRNRHVVTLAMNRILFKQPIFATDLVEMTARVVYVRRFTLEVEIQVTLLREDTVVPSHSGHFIVLNYDEAGFKRPVSTGLRLSEDDPPALLRYLLARERYAFWRAHRPPQESAGHA
jgi:acyl-CoA hydrolase